MTEENNNAGATAEAAATAAAEGVQFQLQRIFLKDLSYESPMGADAFRQKWQPKVGQELHTAVRPLEEDHYEVILKLTVKVSLEEKTAFLVEVQQGGVFLLQGVEGPRMAQIVNTLCPQILFPYAREVIDSCAVKGGFPALALPPVNFDALFARAVEQAAKRGEVSGTA